MTEELFRTDAYLQHCDAKVTHADADGICLDRTVFYPQGGGQPGDTGQLVRADGGVIRIIDTQVQGARHLHITDADDLPAVGESVRAEIDWARRHRLMCMHSCLHLLCAVIPAGVTGGNITDGRGRLDFDLPEPPDKAAIETRLNELIAEDHPMQLRSITSSELRAQPELVRTMSVKPPAGEDGNARVRLVQFGEVDLQPCGGTHVQRSAEIGRVKVSSIKKKGRQNRRVTLELA